MNYKSLTFITGNEGKIKEAQAILGFPIEIMKMDLDEVQHTELEYIVERKVRDAYKVLQKPLLADDAGLFIDAWNGFPGSLIKYIEVAGGNKLLLKMMKSETNRKAYFKSAIGFHDGKKIHIFVGEVKGEIAEKEKGSNGWGFDPIFIPEGHDLTFSEIPFHEKNSMSHRRKALEKLQMFFTKDK